MIKTKSKNLLKKENKSLGVSGHKVSDSLGK